MSRAKVRCALPEIWICSSPFPYFSFALISLSPPPLPGHQQASPRMNLLKVLLSSSLIKGSFFPSSCCLLGGSGVKFTFENRTELVFPVLYHLVIRSIRLFRPFCFGLQTILLFRTDPLPAFNKSVPPPPPTHFDLNTSIPTFPNNDTETKLLMGRNGAT